MDKKRGRGRPPSNGPPPRTNNDNNSINNNYKNLSLFPVDDGGNGHGDARRKKRNLFCRCSTCEIVGPEEIKSLQKSVSMTKQDTNKILEKVLRLEAYFLK